MKSVNKIENCIRFACPADPFTEEWVSGYEDFDEYVCWCTNGLDKRALKCWTRQRVCWGSKVRYCGAKMAQLYIKMSPLGAFLEPKDDLASSKTVRNEILGALGCQRGVFGGAYGALGVEK